MKDFVVLVFLLVLLLSANCKITSDVKNCSLQSNLFQNVSQDLWLKKPTKGLNLRICRSNLTCCSQQMEYELYASSSRILEVALQRQTNATLQFLKTRASQFDGFMMNLLRTSRKKWSEMLAQVYKDNFYKNREIFDDLFITLEDFYTGNRKIDLRQSFRVFLQRTQSTMFGLGKEELLNDTDFINCSARRIDDIQPFGVYPRKITMNMLTTLVYAKVFSTGLWKGYNIASSLIGNFLRKKCIEVFTKAQFCDVCNGIPDARMCNGTCHNVLGRCFHFDGKLNGYWRDYMRGMYALVGKLDGQYDITATFGMFSFDISSAIMEMSKNFGKVLAKAKSLCPSKNRRKREIDRSGSDLYLEGERKRRSSRMETTENPLSIDTFTQEFRDELIKFGDVWTNLPKTVCDLNVFAARAQNESCWNGFAIQRNSEDVPRLGLSLVNADLDYQRKISDQLSKLKIMITNPVKDDDASGDGLHRSDDEESSSASGSGSNEPLGDNESSGSGETIRVKNVVINTPPVIPDYVSNDGTNKTSTPEKTDNYTPTSILITDDEDIPFSGSGDRINNNTLSDDVPTHYTNDNDNDSPTTRGGVKIFVDTTWPSRACHGSVISHVAIFLVATLGLMFV